LCSIFELWGSDHTWQPWMGFTIEVIAKNRFFWIVRVFQMW
jgi:hypothetical protein